MSRTPRPGLLALVVGVVLCACGLHVVGSGVPDGLGPGASGAGDVDADVPVEDATTVPPSTVDASDGSLSPTLTMAWAPAPTTTVNLTEEGTAGWAHWGLLTTTSFNTKASEAGAIPNFVLTTKTGLAQLFGYNDNVPEFRWTDGAPTVTEAGTKTGVACNGDRPTFTLRIPIDANPRRVAVYTNVYKSRARFQAQLDPNPVASPPTHEVETMDDAWGRLQIDVHARAPSSFLVVTFEALKSNGGNLALSAATLK